MNFVGRDKENKSYEGLYSRHTNMSRALGYHLMPVIIGYHHELSLERTFCIIEKIVKNDPVVNSTLARLLPIGKLI